MTIRDDEVTLGMIQSRDARIAELERQMNALIEALSGAGDAIETFRGPLNDTTLAAFVEDNTGLFYIAASRIIIAFDNARAALAAVGEKK